MLEFKINPSGTADKSLSSKGDVDIYFSADVETDGSIPGQFSLLSFALVYAGQFDGQKFKRPEQYNRVFYKELKPISDNYEVEALRVNGLNRNLLSVEGEEPEVAMTEASQWVRDLAEGGTPVLVAYPLSFDWSWLYWYFMRYSRSGSPFSYSSCFDIKTAVAVKASIPIVQAGRSKLQENLRALHKHTHHAVDDAIEQAQIFANVFEWDGINAGAKGSP